MQFKNVTQWLGWSIFDQPSYTSLHVLSRSKLKVEPL